MLVLKCCWVGELKMDVGSKVVGELNVDEGLSVNKVNRLVYPIVTVRYRSYRKMLICCSSV